MPNPGCKKPGAQAASFPKFAVHEMGTWGNSLGQTSFVDVDKDGDLDFISGTGREVSWWEYKSPDQWVRHAIGSGHNTDVGGAAVDVDGDGWIDQVSGDSWYRNLKNGTFERHGFGGIRCHDTRVGDLDGDGKPEVVSLNDNTFLLYRIPANPVGTWPSQSIGSGVHSGLAIADLDGDRDNDIIKGKFWYENTDGKGRMWTERAITYAGSKSTASGAGDFDGDGDMDVALSDHDGERVSWIENVDGKGRMWTEHLLATGKNVLHSLQVADFDNDCDLDIYAGETVGSQFIWQNDGKGAFKEQVIAEGVLGHETRIGDVDGDGDIDLAAKPWKGGRHVYLRNLLVP